MLVAYGGSLLSNLIVAKIPNFANGSGYVHHEMNEMGGYPCRLKLKLTRCVLSFFDKQTTALRINYVLAFKHAAY